MRFDYALTVIIPVRFTCDRPDAFERLEYPLCDLLIPAEISILVVDDGSESEVSGKIELICKRNGYEYCRIDSEQKIFSIGRARNYGAQFSRSKYILFQDIDLVPYSGFYRDVLIEIGVQKLEMYVERFLMFGVIYLSEFATREFFNTDIEKRKSKYIQFLLDDDKERIEKFSTGTSVTVWRRYYYLACGGNDSEFEGWGYEDIEFACRAIRRVKKYPLPEEFSLDYKNCQSILEYKGWKSVYRLFGDQTFLKGIVLFHAWHEIEKNSSYLKRRDSNRLLFEKKIELFRKFGEEPPPLPMPEMGKSVIFRDNAWVYNRWTAPFLGEIIQVDEDCFVPETFVSFLLENGINRVVFHNPYANERMSLLFNAVKNHNISYIVCERGGLPDSVFFDPKGFNGESSSYAPENWNHHLSRDERSCIVEYIRKFRSDGKSLENQPQKTGENKLRKKLGIAQGSKILFVPLQRPKDTVIASFSNPIGGYEDFLRLLNRVAFCLPPDWALVIKRHPLEKATPEIQNALIADDYNVNELVAASDALLVINSGVGLIGLMHNKTVLYAGLAFYGHEGISLQVVDHEKVIWALKNYSPDKEMVLRFLYYLIFRFYSFGKFETKRVDWIDGSFMTATTAIDYYILRYVDAEDVVFEQTSSVQVGDGSILFDRYKDGNGVVRRRKLSALKENTSSPVGVCGERNSTVPKFVQIARDINGKRLNGRFRKKYIKFKNNPVMFFRESKYFIVRKFGQLVGYS